MQSSAVTASGDEYILSPVSMDAMSKAVGVEAQIETNDTRGGEEELVSLGYNDITVLFV
jgi:hypothetical protein